MRFYRSFGWSLALTLTSAGVGRAEPPPVVWAARSQSPAPIPLHTLSDREIALLARCGAGEASLARVARDVLGRKLARAAQLDLDGLAFAQRAAGEPHVWPRAWVISGRPLDDESVTRKLSAWSNGFVDLGEKRCGVAVGRADDGSEVVAAVAVDALADLGPLPTQARAGQWLTLEARLLVPATGARVVVLGPSGPPRTMPTSFANGRVRATFSPDRPGAFTVQVVADLATGPRPVLEAAIFAEVSPPAEARANRAPGEDAAEGASDAEDALSRMVLAMRRAERLPTLARDARLDALARAHARRMVDARTVAHDVGDGDPTVRLRDGGLTAFDAGENVAHSPAVALAHRALYASPSHRANLLRGDFDAMGVGVAEAADGSVWVAELFARGLR